MKTTTIIIIGLVGSIALGGVGFVLGRKSMQWHWERERASLTEDIAGRKRNLQNLRDQVRKAHMANRAKRQPMKEMWRKRREQRAATQPGTKTRPSTTPTELQLPGPAAAKTKSTAARKPLPKPEPTTQKKP
jgi:hypothetical protein